MDCKRFEADIALHVGGDLGGRRVRRLERHLNGCPHCRAYAQTFRRHLVAIKQTAAEPLDAELGAGLAESVMSAVQAAELRRPRLVAAALKAAAVMAAAGVLVLSAYLFRGREPAPAPTPAPTVVQAPAAPPERRKPVVVKMMTDDPRVVFVMLTD